jgi:hypothetical protein
MARSATTGVAQLARVPVVLRNFMAATEQAREQEKRETDEHHGKAG